LLTGWCRRHDYLAFGEEWFAGMGGRTAGEGYVADGVRQKFTQKERDNETNLDYFLARYYSSTQGRFTSFDPEGAGARESDPQSWNGYAYAGGNPVLFSDPDGREYLVCDPNGKNCTRVSDETFAAEREKLKKDGNVYTGNGNFYESGQIKNAEGGVVATYVQFSIDDLQHRQLAAIAAAVDPIPMATLQFFGLSVALGTGGGVVAYYAPAAVPFIAPAVERLSVTGPSVGITLMSQAQNPKLLNIIDKLYRATAKIGSGSTADVIRYERATGKLLSGSGHSIKGRESIRALESLIRSGKLNPAETNIARFLINDLKDALTTPTNPLSIK
jgi:RHS repeat-associated protein